MVNYVRFLKLVFESCFYVMQVQAFVLEAIAIAFVFVLWHLDLSSVRVWMMYALVGCKA